MAEAFVTVARFTLPLEAQLARAFLEGEGIAARLSGDAAATTLQIAGLSGLIDLLVSAGDAARAAELLADHLDKAELNKYWKDEAEADEDVWLCSLCGEPVGVDLQTCPACATARTAVQEDPTRVKQPRGRKSGEKKGKAIRQGAEPVAKPLPPTTAGAIDDDMNLRNVHTFLGDDLARRAFLAAMIGVVFFPLLIYSLWCLIRMVTFPGRLGPTGRRHLYLAIVINWLYFGALGVFWFVIRPQP